MKKPLKEKQDNNIKEDPYEDLKNKLRKMMQ